MQWNAIRGRQVFCGSLILLLSVKSLVYANEGMTQYYYENAQISVMSGQSRASFFLVGPDRIESLTSNARYYLGDGKSYDYFLVHSGLSVKDSPQQSIDYQPYGGALWMNANVTASFGYNGAYKDPVTKFIYLNARDYEPQIMRFVTKDSYHVWNKYSFSNADPINNIDPSGHKSILETYALSEVVFGMLLFAGIANFTYTKYLKWSMENYASKVNAKIDEILDANEITSDAIREQLNSRAGIVSLNEDRIEYNRNSQRKVAIQIHKNNLKTLQNIENILQVKAGMREIYPIVPIDPDSFSVIASFFRTNESIQRLLDISKYRNRFARRIILDVMPQTNNDLDLNRVSLLHHDNDSLTPDTARLQWRRLVTVIHIQNWLNPRSSDAYMRQIYAIN